MHIHMCIYIYICVWRLVRHDFWIRVERVFSAWRSILISNVESAVKISCKCLAKNGLL